MCTWSSSPIASAILKQSQLFKRDGIYEIERRLAKSKLSNELERGGTYGMKYDAYKQTNIDINIAGDAVWPVWGSLRLAPIKYLICAISKP